MNRTQPELSREQILESRMADLRVRFIARAGVDREAISEAWRVGDLEAMREVSHRLAGVAATFGFPRIGEAARDLDRAIDDDHCSNIDAQYQRLVSLLNPADCALTSEKGDAR